MGIFDELRMEKQIRDLLSQCPTDRVYFDEYFTYIDKNGQPHDILYIEKDGYDGYKVRINDDIFDEYTLGFLPANMIYLKLQSVLRNWDENNVK